jgi:hypothetical protein
VNTSLADYIKISTPYTFKTTTLEINDTLNIDLGIYKRYDPGKRKEKLKNKTEWK